jgi:hypothetical protein
MQSGDGDFIPGSASTESLFEFGSDRASVSDPRLNREMAQPSLRSPSESQLRAGLERGD